jgi:OmcA/MtrC family decaheme c-type cytochrome
MAKATITGATIDAAGKVTVQFKVEDDTNKPLAGVKGVRFSVAKLVPKATGESFNTWVPYIYRAKTVQGTGDWPAPDGTSADQGYRESDGTLTDNGNGTYTYVSKTSLTGVVTPVGKKAVAYEKSLTHRVALMMGGETGLTADATFDFVPDGSPMTEKRAIVTTSACKSCHGDDFHGHEGDSLTVETCVTCHNPSTTDPYGGQTADFKVMIHKIHAGGELQSIPGADGKVFDDPATSKNEAADNGSYAIWDDKKVKRTWWKAGFPASLASCAKCHQGTGAQVDNWKNVPSRAACASCHDLVDFATGTNHTGGKQTTDSACSGCHPAAGSGDAVTEAHEWTKGDEGREDRAVAREDLSGVAREGDDRGRAGGHSGLGAVGAGLLAC